MKSLPLTGMIFLLTGFLMCGLPPRLGLAATVDPEMQAVLDEWAALKPKPIQTLTAKEARDQPTLADAATNVLKKQNRSTKPLPLANVNDRKIEGPSGNLTARIYTPEGKAPFPVLLYFHGGGFVIATNDTYDASCRALADLARCVVVSIEYRKAPENKYPAAIDDAYASYQWVRRNADKIGGDARRIAIAGESAGGNMAVVTCLRAKQDNVPQPVYQLLIYPLVSEDMNTESYKQFADAKPLNRSMMEWFFQQYLSSSASLTDKYVTPMHADLTGLPPTMIIAAEIDPLTSEGKAFADKLKQAGVSVDYKMYEGMTHEFFGLGAVVSKAQLAETEAALALKKAFGAFGANPSASAQDR